MVSFSEAIKLQDGILYNLNYHQERVNRTLREFYNTDIDLSGIRKFITPDKKMGLFKCRVQYSSQIESVEFIPYQMAEIKSVAAVICNNIDYSFKYVNRSRLNELRNQSGCDEIIIIKDGLVTDASAYNLVFESDKGLFTPVDCLLKGTKRAELINNGLVAEARITQNDIQNFTKVHFINALVGLNNNLAFKTCRISCIFAH